MRPWLLFISLAVAGYVGGLYFYCRGFLLTRQTLRMNSTCQDVQHPDVGQGDRMGCWMRARYRRLILIVIDALRYDFVRENEHPNLTNPFFQNRLTRITHLLRTESSNSLLLKFTADPPTTTLQRLKALTTGSLPTFIDAGTNFAGSEITEDNILDQMVKLGRNLTVLGDDTWTALYPSQFARRFPLPSFDVKDLHTVDDGILANLYTELSRDDWSVLIAHFLGVDHCGHKYGPRHSAMRAKLDQMNDMLANVTEVMDEDTLLVVLGDHGMTGTGDHGGDSADEVSAALFLYSKGQLHQQIRNSDYEAAQVDLVPTLSLLLDFPIPYSSLGLIIPQVFFSEHIAMAVQANAGQVTRYAQSYFKQTAEPVLTKRLLPLLRIFENLTPDEQTVERCMDTVSQVQGIFRDCWATFHLPWMFIGSLSLIASFTWSIRVMISSRDEGRRALLMTVSVCLQLLAYFGAEEAVPILLGTILAGQIVWDLLSISDGLLSVDRNSLPHLNTFICFLLLICHGLSFFSNSFVVYEKIVCSYLSQTTVLLMSFNAISRRNFVAGQNSKRITSFRNLVQLGVGWNTVAYSLTSLILLRLGSTQFERCREEQMDCRPSWLAVSFQSLSENDWQRQLRFGMALISATLLIGLLQHFLDRNGHLDCDSLQGLLLAYGPWISLAAASVYWVSLWLPEQIWQRNQLFLSILPPLISYAIALVTIITLFLCPALVFIKSPMNAATEMRMKKKNNRVLNSGTSESSAGPGSSQKRDGPGSGQRRDGSGTAVSGPSIALLSSLVIPLLLLLGDGISASVFILFSIVFCILQLPSQDEFSRVCLWSLLSSHSFYAFGHEPTFTAIPWHAAFVGLPGNFPVQAVPALFVLLSLYAGHILLTLSLPLIISWNRYSTINIGSIFLQNSISSRDNRTEYDCVIGRREGDGPSTGSRMARMALIFLTLQAFKMICTTLAALVHRRHLMVWKVFAPKFIFESVSFLIAALSLIFGSLFIDRLLHSLHSQLNAAKSQ